MIACNYESRIRVAAFSGTSSAWAPTLVSIARRVEGESCCRDGISSDASKNFLLVDPRRAKTGAIHKYPADLRSSGQVALHDVIVLERFAGAERHAVERKLGHVAGHFGNSGQELVDIPQ